MQASISRCKGVSLSSQKTRSMVQTPAFTSKPSGRTLSVQVFAKKGKTAFRKQSGIPGQQEMYRKEPPIPEVDPENAEFVVFIRAKKYTDPTTGLQLQNSGWIPLSVVKGGQSANLLVKSMEAEWGRKLFGKTLVRNIAAAVYKDRLEIEKNVKANFPMVKGVPSKDFEYSFKIRDKSVPKDWLKPVDITVFPPEAECNVTPLDTLKAFFSAESINSVFGGSTPAADASSAPKP